jgi:hypothetical protein
MRRRKLPAHLREADLFAAVDLALRRWGRHRWPNWEVFRPVVDLGLRLIDAEALRAVQAEGVPRDISMEDRCRAAWAVIGRAIESLRPPHLEPPVEAALQGLPGTPWPGSVPVPFELQEYLVLAGLYVWRHSVEGVAEVLRVAQRTVANVRRRAVRVVAGRIGGWERAARSAA